MRMVTSRYLGRQIALVVDERVWATPIISGDLPGAEWLVGVRASSDGLKELVAWINGRTGAQGRAGADEAPPRHSYRLSNGYVPDSQTAVRIAEAVLIAVYGHDRV